MITSTYKIIHPIGEYGLGWGYVETIHDLNNISIHSGSAGTFFCQSFLFRNDNIGVVIVTNCYPENTQQLFGPLLNRILDRF